MTQATARALLDAAKALTSTGNRGLRDLSATAGRQLRDHLQPFLLAGRSTGKRTSLLDVQARSSAFAVLVSLCRANTSETLRPLVAEDLLRAAAAETHPGLRRQMMVGLDALPAASLSAAQVKQRSALVDELAPASPPYDKWFGAQDKPTFRVKQYVMGDFWREELAAFRKMGFDVDATSGERAVATKVLTDPAGKSPPVTARVELHLQDEKVLSEVRDPAVHAVIYSGHSQLGAVGKLSAAHARGTDDEKLVAMFACRTKQNLPALRQKFPNSHLLVSNLGTYGHDDHLVMKNLFDGIARRAGWADIERATEKEEVWEKNNYIFPHDKEQWRFVDLDRDGAVEASGKERDVLFNSDVREVAGRSISFKPGKVTGDVSALDASKVADAVSWFNTEHFYWAEDAGSKKDSARADRFQPAGWFTSDSADEVVRVTRSPDGASYRVQVNAAYANQDPDALTMMVTYCLAQQVTAETLPDESEHQRRMRSLAMVGAYTYYHVEFSDVADRLLGKFAERFGFPQTLTWPVVEKAIAADNHAEASDKVTGMLEKGMQYPFLEVNPARSSLAFRAEVQAALDLLRQGSSAVGKATFEAIATGKVRVDSLSDLSRDDFLRVRKDLVKSGVEVSVEDFLKLHDEKSRVSRAITSSMDGYMWDDRVYVRLGQKPAALAETLVHEVNHVLNRSEESYRGVKNVLVEEYRSAYAEELFRTGKAPGKARCQELKEGVIRDYQLQNVKPDDVSDVPPGVIVP